MANIESVINAIVLLLSAILCRETAAIDSSKDGRSIILFTETANCTEGPLFTPTSGRLPIAAAEWTLEQLKQIYNLDIGLDVVSTCGNSTQDKWSLLHALYKYNNTSQLHLLLASRKNNELGGYASSLGLEHTLVDPVPPRPDLVTISELVRHSGMRKAFLLSDDSEMKLLNHLLLLDDVCVLDNIKLPDLQASKNTFSNIIAKFRDSHPSNLVLSGPSTKISKFMRNMQELNVTVDGMILHPWDTNLTQSVEDITTGNASVLLLEPKQSVVADFYSWVDAKLGTKNDELNDRNAFDDPLAWQIIKAIYSVMVHNDSRVDFNSVKEGLQLSSQPKEFRIQERSPLTLSWHQLGAYTGGQFTWVRSQEFWNVNNHCSKGWCTCVNGLWENKPVWIFDTWVTAFATLAGLGLTCCLAIFVFLCSQCGQVLEGGQATTFLLLSSTVLTFSSMLPYCFEPGNLVCTFRTTAPAVSVTFLVSILLSRSLLLATSDSGGLPGHASGCLQAALLLLMLSVEAALFGLEAWHRKGNFFNDDGTCYHRSWEWLVMMAWPAILLLIQTFLTPGIWRSRRNYKEGVLFSLASIAVSFVTGAWVAVYIVCAELYGDHWEDISVCAGLVATATCVILIIFIPKVYLMTVWGSGQDLSLHLPETATSTLHTDTLSYIPANTNIYKTKVDQNMVAYVNLNPNRETNGKLTNSNGHYGSSNSNSHYGSSYIMGTRTLIDAAKPSNLTYRLDTHSEPADNISWEPFYSGSNSRTGPPILAQSQSTLPIQQQSNDGTLGGASTGIPSTRL